MHQTISPLFLTEFCLVAEHEGRIIGFALGTTIEILLQMMLRISCFLRESYPDIVYNLRDLYSSPFGFIAPDRCEAWIDIHVPPDTAIGEFVTSL